MAQEMNPRLVRVVDFVAESLEAEANRMPPGFKPQADSLRKMATTMRESDNPKMVRVWEEVPDYRIEQGGTLVAMLSERATQRGTGPKPRQGSRIAFRSRYDTAEFVRAGEAEGFTFEGKEFIADAL